MSEAIHLTERMRRKWLVLRAKGKHQAMMLELKKAFRNGGKDYAETGEAVRKLRKRCSELCRNSRENAKSLEIENFAFLGEHAKMTNVGELGIYREGPRGPEGSPSIDPRGPKLPNCPLKKKSLLWSGSFNSLGKCDNA